MVARIKLIVLTTLISYSGFSQELTCGTEASNKDIEALKQLDVASFTNARSGRAASTTRIAITAHIVRKSDGTGGLTEQELTDAIATVNSIYTLTNMEFFLFGEINYIDDNTYFDFNSSQETELASQHFVANTINVYFFNSAMSGDNPVCGYARFPASGIDRIVMVNDCTVNGSTFPHELGHYFALYHTHGKTNNGTTDELVTRGDGANCENAGDDLCDTEADPNLSGFVNSRCVYWGSATDANGDSYVPNAENLMSYSLKECRDEFSQGQADRIVAAYQQFKTYLYDKNYASIFDASSREVCRNGMVEFIDQSINAQSYSWTFQGGTPANSTDANPEVSYNELGNYDVTLEITGADGGTHTKVFEDYIVVKDLVTSDITTKNGSFEEVELAEAVYNEDGSETWEKTSDVFTDGSSSVMMDFYNYNAAGAEDYLVVATLNTSEEKYFALTFDYAYAQYSSVYSDGLELVYRDPCGQWQTAWSKSGSQLATAPSQTTLFEPTSDQWISETVQFGIDESIDVVEFAFKSINAYGNNLYIDNYSIDVFDPSFSITDIEVAKASCIDTNDGSITVTVSGSGDFQYSIVNGTFINSNVFENLFSGTYDLVVRSGVGVEITEKVEVAAENEYPETPVIELENDLLSITLGANQTVQWYLNNQPIDGATDASLSFEQTGSYTAIITNGACSTTSDPFLVLSAHEVEARLEVYPNPASDYLSISLPAHLQKEVEEIVISDLSGRELQTVEYQDKLDVGQLNSGLYILQFELEGQNIVRRFLKQ